MPPASPASARLKHASAVVEVAVGGDVAERLPDQRFGVDFEHAAGRCVGARDGAVGVEADHRIGIVVEDRAEARFARLDLGYALRCVR